MGKRLLLALIFVASGIARADIDLESLPLEGLCKDVKRKTFTRDRRSADVYCNVDAHKSLINFKAKREAKVISKEDFEKNQGLLFKSIYYNTEIIADADKDKSKVEYKEYFVGGELIGYRGTIELKDKRGARAILGAYFTPAKNGKLKDLAKVYVLDRSKPVRKDVPEDLKAALKVFESKVRPEEEQDLWALTAQLVTLQGKDLYYSTSNILLDLAKNLGDIGVYKLQFNDLDRVENAGLYVLGSPTKTDYGAYCENLLVKGKPLDPDKDPKMEQCVKLTNELIAGIAATIEKSSKWLLYSAIDEEERGYLIVPSKEAKDTYLKVYFDISHNE